MHGKNRYPHRRMRLAVLGYADTRHNHIRLTFSLPSITIWLVVSNCPPKRQMQLPKSDNHLIQLTIATVIITTSATSYTVQRDMVICSYITLLGQKISYNEIRWIIKVCLFWRKTCIVLLFKLKTLFGKVANFSVFGFPSQNIFLKTRSALRL